MERLIVSNYISDDEQMVNKSDYTVFNINKVFLLHCTDFDLRASIFHEMGKQNRHTVYLYNSPIFWSTDDLSQRRGKGIKMDNLPAIYFASFVCICNKK